MKKKYDFTLVVIIGILVIFALFTIIYFSKTSAIKDNTLQISNNLNIYKEHTHKGDSTQTNTIEPLQKSYVDLASYTTKIYDTETNRIHNIKLACKQLDGHIITPNEEFSFNNTMGTMGKDDGYKKSTGFDSNGNKIKMYGGGICQISSTLYNAVLATSLKVTERHAHSRRVYYVPKNKDATVYYGGPDFKFLNTLDNNIMICASTDGYTVKITLKEEKNI